MATALATSPTPKIPRTLSLEGLVTIVGAVILFLTIVFFNLALVSHLDTKIDSVRTELEDDINNVRTELKADIDSVRTELKEEIDSARSDVESVRMELKADIQRLEADIQRLDDRLFAVIAPPVVEDEPATSP